MIVNAHSHPRKASQERNTQVICFIYLHSSDRQDPPETGHRNMLWKGVEHLWDNTGQRLHQHQPIIIHSHHCALRKAQCVREQCVTVTTFTRLLCDSLLLIHIYWFCSRSTLHDRCRRSNLSPKHESTSRWTHEIRWQKWVRMGVWNIAKNDISLFSGILSMTLIRQYFAECVF